MEKINLDGLSLEEKLILMELLSEKIMEAIPDSLIAAQVVYHARFLNGNAPQRKQHRHERGVK